MFEIGDYVLNATNGICKISEIVELEDVYKRQVPDQDIFISH